MNDNNLLLLNELTPQEIVELLSLEDIKKFILSLGVTEIQETKKELILPTICHNPLGTEASMKLYWYQNTHLFHCYTECNDNMTIYELYTKFIKINYGKDIHFYEALEYVKQFVSGEIIEIPSKKEATFTFERDYNAKRNQITECSAFNESVLQCFIYPYHHPTWVDEGISGAAMDKFGIAYSISQNKIIIPHRDINGRLIGIRGRAINAEDIALGKYRPIWYGDVEYAHPLSYNLYGLFENKEAIKVNKKAIIVEGEKSVLKGYDYFGNNNIIVASCGSNFTVYQLNLLTLMLGVTEIIIAFDRQYKEPFKEDGKRWRKKIFDLCSKYKNFCTFTYIFDEGYLLDYKDSPLDQGKDIFLKLYKERKTIV